MKRSDVLTLFDYNYWATARVLNSAAHLSEGQFTAPARLSHGSVRGTLAHTLATEIVWRLRCQEGISPVALPGESEFPTLELLRSRWAKEEQAMRSYLNALTDEVINQPIHYKTTKGIAQETILWHILAHVVNHGTQFRSEAAVVLSEYGHSPGDLDLIAYVREQKP